MDNVMKICTKMKLTTSDYIEYKMRHENVDIELENQFKMAGVSNYTIWYDKDTNELFAYVELQNIEKWEKISKSSACQKWWDFMSDIMETNSDNSPKSIELLKVYEYKDKV